jgi:hypothetical protein
LWYDTWNSRRMTSPTRLQVQNSPRNPYRAAPWDNNSGKRAFSSAVSFGTAPRRGRACSPALPSCATRFIHWLTAPLVTPKTSATSSCVQPSCLSSNACHRRCSCHATIGDCFGSTSPWLSLYLRFSYQCRYL